jgi:hypothetical protein
LSHYRFEEADVAWVRAEWWIGDAGYRDNPTPHVEIMKDDERRSRTRLRNPNRRSIEPDRLDESTNAKAIPAWLCLTAKRSSNPVQISAVQKSDNVHQAIGETG